VGAFTIVAAVGDPSEDSGIDGFRGLARRRPALAGSFAVLLLGMAGLPVTSGFIAKFGVFTDAWGAGYQWLVVVAVVASVIAFAFYLRIIVVMFMEDTDMAAGTTRISSATSAVIAVAVSTTLVWGILPGSLLQLATDAIPI
jgi:NADH-quinone oxidoreductase subunit N